MQLSVPVRWRPGWPTGSPHHGWFTTSPPCSTTTSIGLASGFFHCVLFCIFESLCFAIYLRYDAPCASWTIRQLRTLYSPVGCVLRTNSIFHHRMFAIAKWCAVHTLRLAYPGLEKYRRSRCARRILRGGVARHGDGLAPMVRRKCPASCNCTNWINLNVLEEVRNAYFRALDACILPENRNIYPSWFKCCFLPICLPLALRGQSGCKVYC